MCLIVCFSDDEFLFLIYLQQGGIDIFVDSSFHCLINHGCNGSNNVGHDLTVTEANADPNKIPDEVSYRKVGPGLYNPFAMRQVHFFSSAIPRRDIAKGEELFDNYLGMSGQGIDGWTEDVLSLRAQCRGDGVGVVMEYGTVGDVVKMSKEKILLPQF